jgi:glycosyltransferase involved in cell wall biosynthesis
VSADAPGGRETQLAGLVKQLQRRGVKNCVLATGDSVVEGELVSVFPRNLVDAMRDGEVQEYHYYEQHQLCLAHARAAGFDLVHSHLSPPVFAGFGDRFLHTQHTPVWHDLEWLIGQHPNRWLSTVSDQLARRLRAHGATRCEVIHNGIETAAFTFQPARRDGLVFLGRMEHGKGPDIAVQVARQLGRPLTLAGPITDGTFFDQHIRPFLGSEIQYVGVVNHAQKNELLGAAGCAVLPFRGQEGFGLVAVEAMACGTPVVALSNGALPEIVEPGVTGHLTANETGLAELVTGALQLDREGIRRRVAERFDISITAAKYHALYERIIHSAA